ncbi:MAG: amino acid permease [Rhizobiales bacterium]|nr:amino acid permease [Hyphomicrobiales bacterium]
MSLQKQATPRASLSRLDAISIMVGIVIGIGIFRFPSLVASNVPDEATFIAIWVIGGAITLVGALVYAELAAAYPSTGGEYHFLTRAFGQPTGFMFAWARISVIQTGAIAVVAFVFGDYAQQIVPLGTFGPSIYAGAAVAALTAVNLVGTYEGKNTQHLFTGLTVLAILAVVVTGFASPGAVSPPTTPAETAGGAIGLALLFVLFTYGGWNEAAYLSAELRDVRRDMIRVLVLGTGAIVVVYVLINLAYLYVLGIDGVRGSEAVAADLMRNVLGESGAVALSLIICCTALSTLNATIFTGARVYHALGEDLTALRGIGAWSGGGNNPRNALLLQGVIALGLVTYGAVTRSGIQALVEYTFPVFWLFLLLVGVSYVVLRYREPRRERPFRAPLYPLTPIIFILTCGYLLYSTAMYSGLGAVVGIAVLLLGLPLLFLLRMKQAVSAAE